MTVLSPLVELEEVSLRYRRRAAPALHDVTCALSQGVVALIGVNGAGKTSLLRVLSGAIAPTSGTVRVEGRSLALYRRDRALGCLPEHPSFPSYLTVAEFLAGLRRSVGSPPSTEAEEALHEEFALASLADRLLGELSLGQQRRVELAAALIGDPALVLLDEPTNGLDPFAVTALRAGIFASRRPGRLLVVSSHHLDELQRLADHILVLAEGKLVGSWSAAEVAALAGSFEELLVKVVRPNAI